MLGRVRFVTTTSAEWMTSVQLAVLTPTDFVGPAQVFRAAKIRASVALRWFVVTDHVNVVAHSVGDLSPIDCRRVTQFGIFRNDHGTPCDVSQAVQSDLPKVDVVVDHECQSRELRAGRAADQHQIREQLSQVVQAGHAVHDQVLSDLAQQGEADVEVGRFGGVEQHDLHVTIDDGAVVQRGKAFAAVAHVDVAANLLLDGRGRDGQRPQPDERGPPPVHGRHFLSKGRLYFICPSRVV